MSSATARLQFAVLVGAHALAQFGSVMILITLPWFVLQTTGSAARTGFTGAALAAAAVTGGIFGGALVDWIGFKRGSFLADFVSAGAILAIPLVSATMSLSYVAVLILIFLARVLDIPAFTARRSLVPELSERAGMPLERANGLFEGAQHIALLTGPVAAGLAIAMIGAVNTFAVIAAIIFLAGLAVLLLIPGLDECGSSQTSDSNGFGAGLFDGIRFIFHEKVILAVLIALVGLNLLTAPLVGVILPVYVEEALGNASYLGLLVSALGVGTLAGALLYAAYGQRLPRRALWLGGQVVLPLPFLALLFDAPVAVLAASFIIVGIGNGPLNPLMVTIRHERAPVERRGRVFSAFSAAAQLAGPLGMMLAGVLIEGIGLAMVLTTIIILVAVLWVCQFFVPQLRQLERPDSPL